MTSRSTGGRGIGGAITGTGAPPEDEGNCKGTKKEADAKEEKDGGDGLDKGFNCIALLCSMSDPLCGSEPCMANRTNTTAGGGVAGDGGKATAGVGGG